MSYNVNGLANKYLYPLFFTYLKSFDVIILVETHLMKESTKQAEKYFPGFDIFWTEAIKINRFGRAIGGKMLGIKKSLKNLNLYYELVTAYQINALCIKVNNKRITLLPLYLRSANWEQDFSLVKQFMNEMAGENPILIGDMNIRIGELQQDISMHQDTFLTATEIRKSMDKEVNHKGRVFLDHCNNHSIVVLNGHTKGDEEGKFTFLSSAGESVNDICAVSYSMLKYVTSFSVEDCIWSDHFPIVLDLKLDVVETDVKKLSLLPKLLWRQSDLSNYQRNLNCHLRKALEDHTICTLKDLTNTIIISAQQRGNKPIFNPLNKWFNSNCYWARKKSFKSLAKFRKTNSEEHKKTYLESKKKFKEICESSKQNYYNSISLRINEVSNAKEWWSIARELNGQDFNIGSSVSAREFEQYFKKLLNLEQRSRFIPYAPLLIADEKLDKDISVDDIKNMLSKVKMNKAPGEDRTPYEFFANASEEFLTELARTYSRMYSNGTIDEVFIKTIIFPIHKKGSLNDPANYRGISFMNAIAKIFMGILNERLYAWAEERSIIVEYQAGFRKNYSTTDNIYNLSAIINIKLSEKKKTYAFFVDFKAAFDNISRNLMLYKLYELGLSYKLTKIIESAYQRTETAVWTGNELSEYFNTNSGVKQGCLLSPLLFTLYVNDIHDSLGGGIMVDDINIRVLLYADDIVILAEDKDVLQRMIYNLEDYCVKWNLIVNLAKSKIMVFRNGGRLSAQERWTLNNEQIEVVSEYNYLGFILTPQMKFNQHVAARTTQAKLALNMTWKNFLSKNNISMNQKWNLYMAVCRSIQSYGAQVWGFGCFDEADKLQRFFLKKVLKLPDSTPNYAITLETGVEEGHIYMMQMHLHYITRTKFQYKRERLPYQLTQKIIQKKLFWAHHLNNLLSQYNIPHIDENFSLISWNAMAANLIEEMSLRNKSIAIQRAQQSSTRLYKYLDYTRSHMYLSGNYTNEEIAWIFKARCDLIFLNANHFATHTNANDQCTICNLQERETLHHFLGICPIYRHLRNGFFGRSALNEDAIIRILDGTDTQDWKNLIGYIKAALHYRKLITTEFA